MKNLSKIFLIGIVVLIAVYIGVFIGRSSAGNMVSIQNKSKQSNSADADSVRKINLNTASEEELYAIPGMSKSLASEIVSYREKYGKYYHTKELLDFDEMTKALYESILPYITV